MLKSIDEQGKLTPELRAAIDAAPTKQELEDLYLPYKPKRRTKGMIAREAGIEPLADGCLPTPRSICKPKPQLSSTPMESPLPTPVCRAGRRARHPVRALGRRPHLVGKTCATVVVEGLFKSKLMDGKDENNPMWPSSATTSTTTSPWRVPSHRALAVFRGRTLEILDAKLVLDEEVVPAKPSIWPRGASRFIWAGAQGARRRPDPQVHCLDLEGEAVAEPGARPVRSPARRRRSHRHQGVCRQPARPVAGRASRPARGHGPGPGIRTGVKVAVVSDATGKVLDTPPCTPRARKDWEVRLHTLAPLCAAHGVNLIAIGNGTQPRNRQAGRRPDQAHPADGTRHPDQGEKVVVSEAGASVYSASNSPVQECPIWT